MLATWSLRKNPFIGHGGAALEKSAVPESVLPQIPPTPGVFMDMTELERIYTDTLAGRLIRRSCEDLKGLSPLKWAAIREYLAACSVEREALLKRLVSLFSGGGALDYVRREMGLELERKLEYDLAHACESGADAVELLEDFRNRLDEYIRREPEKKHAHSVAMESKLSEISGREAKLFKTPMKRLARLLGHSAIADALERASIEYATAASHEYLTPHFIAVLEGLKSAVEKKLAAHGCASFRPGEAECPPAVEAPAADEEKAIFAWAFPCETLPPSLERHIERMERFPSLRHGR